MYDIVIIGGGIAGMTAAIYSARGGMKALLIESCGYGGQITVAPKVENYPGFSAISGNELASTVVDQVLRLGVETEFCTVTGIENHAEKKVVLTDSGNFECRAVIVASGSQHRKLGIDGESELVGNGVSYCAVCDGVFFKGERVAVVGGGNAAFQYAEFLADICREVALIHRRTAFRADEQLVARVKKLPNVHFMTPCVINDLVRSSELSAVTVKDVTSGAMETFEAKGLFVAVGQIPATEFSSGMVDRDVDGYIVAGEDCKTSADGIFVAGDCRKKQFRQLATAAADGAVAALAACEYVRAHR